MNVKRNLLTSVLLSALIGAGAAGAADWSDQVRQGFFGSPAKGTPDATIRISGTTGNLYVKHYATARIENAKGQSFAWYFDPVMSMAYFPLKLIAPGGFDAGNTQVSVLHPPEHSAE